MATTKIPAEFLSTNAIQGTLIADNAITTVHIAQNAITSVQIPNNSIGTVQIALNTVTGVHIAQNSVTTVQLATNSVNTLNIADDQVTADKLAAAAVVTASIVDLNVTEAKIAANSITATKIPDGSITATQLGANSVTLAKMASLARGSILLGNSAADVSALAIGSNGYVLKSDGTDAAWAAEQSIAANSVTSGMIASNSILTRHIDDDQVTGDQLADTITVVTSVVTPLVDAAVVDGENFKVNGGQGSDGQVLTSTGSGVAWEAAGGGVDGISSSADATAITIGSDENVTFSGNISSVANLYVADDIGHAGDSNTYISFEADARTDYVGGTRLVDLAPGSIVLNEGSGDVDFRVESNGNANMLFVDGGNDFVGIGTASPLRPLQVGTHGTGNGEIAIGSATNGVGSILFGDGASGSDIYRGYIQYNHTDDALLLATAAGERMRITSAGNVGINTTTPGNLLEVSHSAGSHTPVLRLTGASTSGYAAGLEWWSGYGPKQTAAMYSTASGSQGGEWWLQTRDQTSNTLITRMSINNAGDVTLGGGSAAYNVFTVGRTGTGGQGAAHLKLKTPGASYMDWWDAGDGNTIRLYTYSVNLRMKDMPNGDDCIQFEAAGNIDIDGSYLTGGFDYAEYFESTDGTAIPVGTSVVLVNEKVKAATSGEQPLGVVRPGKDGTSVVGGAAPLKWDGKYLKDDYDAFLYDTVDYWTWKDVGDTNETGDEDQQCWSDRVPAGWVVPADKKVTPTQRKRLNPDFVENLDADGNQIYENREERDEWNCIGLLGQVPITKGQVINSNWTKLKDRSATVELWFIK